MPQSQSEDSPHSSIDKAGFPFKKVLSTLQLNHDYSVKPAGLQWRSNTFFIIATVAVGLFTDLFLYGLIVPVLPYMLGQRVGIPEDQIQSQVSALLAAYAGASVLGSPLAGVLADKVSTRQAPFLGGLFSLLLATILLFLGRSIAVLTVARVFQGISAAMVWTIGLALCLETVGPENLGKTIGSIFSFISVGNLAAPVLGGVLYDKTGYPGVFGIGFAVLAIDFIMRLLVIEKKVAARYEKNDPNQGDLQQTTSHSTPDDTDPEWHPQHDDENGEAPPPYGEDSPLLGKKKESEEYKLPEDMPWIARKVPLLATFRSPSLLCAFLVAFIQATTLSTFDATVPTHAQSLFGFSSLESGLLFIPLGVFDLVLGPLAGWAVDRYGVKPAAVFGYAFLVPIFGLLRLPHEGDMKQVILYGGLLALCGIGLAVIGAPSIVESGAVVQKYYETNPEFFGAEGPYAQLYGINSMVFSAGLTLGPLMAGGLTDTIGYGDMNAVVAGICALTAILSWLYLGGKPQMLRERGLRRRIKHTLGV
ncbi:MFS general substrate transporter [Viridothelium virens]|uniref:MFS general substrate transporter n=1 Tax=Viridothelium virens TaxID=1048519 RepID=A0A6A6HP91_VIRVR|nr:MFS general substrate transporter [Viridothelium virens]